MPDVRLQNPDVVAINRAITSLMATTVPPSPSVTGLYNRWVHFISSPTYAALPDTVLYPVYTAFALAYRVIAGAHGVPAADIEPRLLVLASGDAQASIQAVGRALDQTLETAAKAAHTTGSVVTRSLWQPALLIVAVALSIGWARRGR